MEGLVNPKILSDDLLSSLDEVMMNYRDEEDDISEKSSAYNVDELYDIDQYTSDESQLIEQKVSSSPVSSKEEHSDSQDDLLKEIDEYTNYLREGVLSKRLIIKKVVSPTVQNEPQEFKVLISPNFSCYPDIREDVKFEDLKRDGEEDRLYEGKYKYLSIFGRKSILIPSDEFTRIEFISCLRMNDLDVDKTLRSLYKAKHSSKWVSMTMSKMVVN
ncbi:hypothetical protein 1 [Soybean thrips rhabdo-like virus 1]|uniref:Uncharacterized protein n=1 Tax=Soybean thrips rhabdo-like virus 1 TaxID=2802235 RepID=A0A7T8JI75_9RHAB|nr:hypothetical protein 1 [Soybean thrips rhabdo-like virus 1]